MADFIDSIGELTFLRDKDELEITLATVMFELVEASALSLWRIVRYGGETRLRERVRQPVTREAADAFDTCVAISDLPLLASRPDLQACYDANLFLRRPPDTDGMYGHLFPVSDGRDVICLLEILRPVPLHDDQERLIFGLLRIYRNHLGILDYSDRDELTGLLNRRTFDESFKRLASQEKAAQDAKKTIPNERRQPSTGRSQTHLAVIDIDFFKRVNDQFGHPYGDEVLVLLARLMSQCFRDTDRLFRFGGEEFLVILPGADLPEAELALERFRAMVEAFHFPQVGRVTVSIGFTAIGAGDTGSNVFGRADEALYVAKQSGRNRVLCYELLVAEGILSLKQVVDQNIEMF
jgi:diguanylate cyclase (GGDEF)-like protein